MLKISTSGRLTLNLKPIMTKAAFLPLGFILLLASGGPLSA